MAARSPQLLALCAAAALLVQTAAVAAASQNTTRVQCGTSSNYSTSFCPADMPCCYQQYSPSGFGCAVPVGDSAVTSAGCGDGLGPPTAKTVCCKMGPGDPPSATLPNVLVIGDSVSIGYVGGVTETLNASGTAAVQHGPWDVSDGGAGDTAWGITCLDRWLVTQAQLEVKWDVVTFNFGLHDMTNSSHCEQLYRAQLTNITTRLVATGATLLYVTTTPFMPKRTLGDHVVEQMNAVASEVVAAHNIKVVDLYSVVTSVCGPVYTNCSICRVLPCSYHYNALGEETQALVLAMAIEDAINPAPPPPPAPPPWEYTWQPRIHWAQGCLEGCIAAGVPPRACRAGTHDISGGIIQSDGTFHAWVGCFMSEPGGGWQHVSSTDLVHWDIEKQFNLSHFVQAGAVGIDDDGQAFAVECAIDAPGKPAPWRHGKPSTYNIYPFSNSSDNGWSDDPIALFDVYATRYLPGDPPRPWLDPRDNKWYALLSFDGCNETTAEAGLCPKGGEAKMWSSPALFGPQAEWTQTPSLLVTNETVLDGRNGLPNRPSTREMVTSDFFPLQGHPLVNAVYITTRYGPGQGQPGVKPDPDGPGTWNYLMAYVGRQDEPGQPMTVLHRVCLDWGSFVRTTGWHGIDAAVDAGTTYGVGKSMRSAEGKGDTGRRILVAWMSNGYWDGHGMNYDASGKQIYDQGLPKDSLSLPRDMTFAADGRLLQRFVPELEKLRITGTHEQLQRMALSGGAPVWLKTAGRQLEIAARFEVAGNCSFGLYVLASKSLTEYTTIGVDMTDDLAFVDRMNSSGASPLVPNRGILDMRAGLLPPLRNSSSGEGAADGTRVVNIHVIVDGPIVSVIVLNETALSVYVYPQLQSSGGVALWSSGTGTGTAVHASVDVWPLRSVFDV